MVRILFRKWTMDTIKHLTISLKGLLERFSAKHIQKVEGPLELQIPGTMKEINFNHTN